jgi:hypothetical protein
MKRTMMALALLAGMAACGGDPMKASNAALAAKDAVKADALLEAVLKDNPELRLAHLQHYVVAQYLAAQGDPSRQKAFLDKALNEYDWLVKSYGLTADYKDMETSLKTNAQAAADLAAARKPLYGD